MVVTGITDTMYAGNPRTFHFTITDEDGVTAKDLTDLDVEFVLSKINPNTGAFSTTATVTKKSTAGVSQIEVTDAAGGELDVHLVAGDTASLSGDYYFELELRDSSGNGVVVSTGTLTIVRNVIAGS